MARHYCQACGDPINDIESRAKQLKKDTDQLLIPGELQYCLECADEKFRGMLYRKRARLFSSGHGCPLEPGDDASPGGENAIRDMEG